MKIKSRLLTAFLLTNLLVWTCIFFTSQLQAQNIPPEAQKCLDRGLAAVQMAKTNEDYQSAIKEFQKASALAPAWPDVYYNMGVVFNQMELFADAKSNFQKYLDLSPGASDAGEVRTIINQLEYKIEKANETGSAFEKLALEPVEIIQDSWILLSGDKAYGVVLHLYPFRLNAGKLEFNNGDYAKNFGRPDIANLMFMKEWVPVTVNGMNYAYEFEYLIDRGIDIERRKISCKGEIISVNPFKVKEIITLTVVMHYTNPYDKKKPYGIIPDIATATVEIISTLRFE